MPGACAIIKHNLWRPECTILFVGYQSIGTPGRALVDGVKEMRLFGETVDVNAQIRVLTGISGHADKNGLIDWIEGFETKPKKCLLCTVRISLRCRLRTA